MWTCSPLILWNFKDFIKYFVTLTKNMNSLVNHVLGFWWIEIWCYKKKNQTHWHLSMKPQLLQNWHNQSLVYFGIEKWRIHCQNIWHYQGKIWHHLLVWNVIDCKHFEPLHNPFACKQLVPNRKSNFDHKWFVSIIEVWLC